MGQLGARDNVRYGKKYTCCIIESIIVYDRCGEIDNKTMGHVMQNCNMKSYNYRMGNIH